MKYTELSDLSDEGLVHRELEMERSLVRSSFQQKSGQLQDSSLMGKLRRDIARLRTAQRERERAQGMSVDTLRNRYRGTYVAAGSEATVVEAEAPAAASAGFLKGLASKLGIGGTEEAPAE